MHSRTLRPWQRTISTLVMISFLTLQIIPSVMAYPASPSQSIDGIYPIALKKANIQNLGIGSIIQNILNGFGPGNFGWLTWTGNNSAPALSKALIPPGTSNSYVNPYNKADHELSVGDWVQGVPGVNNSSDVRAAVEQLKHRQIVIPVWDEGKRDGGSSFYHIIGFAKVEIIDDEPKKSGKNGEDAKTIRAIFYGMIEFGTTNNPPVANAGPDQNVITGITVTLDGSASTDPDQDPLTYNWILQQKPQDSIVTLSSTTVQKPTFIADRSGSYTFQLMVNDGKLNSPVDAVTIIATIPNYPPVANAGPDQNAYVNSAIILDGTASSDPDGDKLTYQWSMANMPAGSQAVLADTDTAHPSFIMDKKGSYEAQLVVNDGKINSAPDNVLIKTNNRSPVANAGLDQDISFDITKLTWKKDPGIRIDTGEYAGVGAAYPDIVQLSGGSYRMYYTAFEGLYIGYRILSAYSSDGINWTKEAGIRIDIDTPLDSRYAYAPSVVKLEDGSYRMYYSGYTGYYYYILSAVSVDGLVWTKEPGARMEYAGPFFPPQSITNGDTIRLCNGQYRMYYSEPGPSPYHPTSYQGGPHIVSAISSDGLTWEKEEGVRIDYGHDYDTLYAANPKIIILPGSIYRMYYTGYDGDQYYLLSAVSVDGLNWTKETGEVVAAGAPGEYDSSLPGTADVIHLPDGAFRIYYAGNNGSNMRILSALSDQKVLPPAVNLDGSGSFDPDADPLTYNWTFLSKPICSNAVLANTQTLAPTFAMDKAGPYEAQLIVNDGEINSSPDSVLIRKANHFPTAEINSVYPVHAVKDAMWGNGAYSLPNAVMIGSEAGGLIPGASFIDPITGAPATTDFVSAWVGDKSGEVDSITMTAYDINNKVIGTSSYTSMTGGDFGMVSVSVPGIHRVEFIDASPSGADFDNFSFNYNAVRNKPGSNLILINFDNLSISEGGAVLFSNEYRHLGVVFENSTRRVGAPVRFDGSDSSDPDADALTYTWSLTSKPQGSFAELVSATTVTCLLTPDVVGTYEVKLVINDGKANSVAAATKIEAIYSYQVNHPPVADAGTDQQIVLGVSQAYPVLKWGSLGSGEGQFNQPEGIAVHGDFVYVTDEANNRIQKFDKNGNFIKSWGGFGYVWGMAADSQGNLYVVDYGNNRIQKFDGDGNFITGWGSSGTTDGLFTSPRGIAVDNQGYVYVADFGNSRIQKFDLAGNFILKWGTTGSGPGQFISPACIAIDSAGYVYVGEHTIINPPNYRIQKFDRYGNFITLWGTQGTGDGQFKDITGITIDAHDHIYVTEYNQRVQVFDKTGNFITKWGSYGNGDMQFNDPTGIAIDNEGFIYIAERDNHRIGKFGLKDSLVRLDGSKSYDPDGDPLTYRWSLPAKPSDSAASLTNSDTVNPTFIVDQPGEYQAQLIVNDGKVDSVPSVVRVTAVTKPQPKLNLAVANANNNSVSILLGNGDGTFQDQNPFVVSVGARPCSISKGDFNQDGFTDLAVANVYSDTAAILLGKGDGTFLNQYTYTVGRAPHSIAIGDFNQDGVDDLATADAVSNTVSVLLGKGDGTFKSPATIPAGNGPHTCYIADFNRDGINDIVVTDMWSNAVSVLLGKGDGTFQNQVQYSVGTDPRSVCSGDFNRDGFVDLAVSNYESSFISILLGNGDGTFNPQTTYATGNAIYFICSSDINKDGFADLAVANSESQNISILLGNGDGTFQSPVPYAAADHPIFVCAGDFNQDKLPDLAVTNYRSNTVSVFINNGEGTLKDQVAYFPRPDGSDLGPCWAVPFEIDYVSSSSGTIHSVPIANAGPNRSGVAGNNIVLDGSASSDPNGYHLSFSWAVTSSPQGSNPVIADAATAQPKFQTNLEGKYSVTLTIDNGHGATAQDTVMITVAANSVNHPPVAQIETTHPIYIYRDGVGGAGAYSLPNAGGVGSLHYLNPVGIPCATFFDPLTGNPATTDFVSAWVGDKSGEAELITMTAYDLNGTVIGTSSYASIRSGDFGLVQISVPGIHRVELCDDDPSTADFDDFTFNFNAVQNVAGSNLKTINFDTIDTVDNLPNGAVAILSDQFKNLGVVFESVTHGVWLPVNLDGRKSTDPDFDALTYKWSILSKPTGSSAVLSNTDTATLSLLPDVGGNYDVQLIVNDGKTDSAPIVVHLDIAELGSTVNHPPVANAGNDVISNAGETLTLNGSGSNDPDGDNLIYQWNIISKPEGSSTALTGTDTVAPSIAIDNDGTYEVQLIINDGKINSQPDTILIKTANQLDAYPSLQTVWQKTLNLAAGYSQYMYTKTRIPVRLIDDPYWQWTSVVWDGPSIGDENSGARLPVVYPWAYWKPEDVEFVQLWFRATVFVPADIQDIWLLDPYYHGYAVPINACMSIYVNGSFVTTRGSAYEQYWGVYPENRHYYNTPDTSWSVSPIDMNSAPWHKGAWNDVWILAEDTCADGGLGYLEFRYKPIPPESNNIPIAEAGENITVQGNPGITLNGSGSHDADGDLLAYQWTVISKPADSAPVLLRDKTVVPIFIPDKPGVYAIQLIVTDGVATSSPDTITIYVVDQNAPVANAGPDRIVTISENITLDGSASSDPDGNVLNYVWTILNKPQSSNAELTSSNTVTPNFVPDVAGTYDIQLVVNDGVQDSAPAIVHVVAQDNNQVNQSPLVSAGLNQTITLPAQANLTGSVTDDGLPQGSTIAVTWTQQSGPGTVAFSNPNLLTTTAVFSEPGNYVLRLTATDSILSSFAEVSINVVTADIPGLLSLDPANSQQGQTLNVSIIGQFTHFEQGSTQVSFGPDITVNSVTVTDATHLQAQILLAALATVGTRSVIVTTSSEIVSLTDAFIIQEAIVVNQAPVVSAGVDQTITLPNKAMLSGSVTDDGLPAGSIITQTWYFVSGPAPVAVDDNHAITATTTYTVAGTYVLRLIASDGELTGHADVTITVLPAVNQPPVANAGGNKIISINTQSTLDGTASSDPDGDILMYQWLVTSSPQGSNPILTDDSTASAKFLADIAGDYILTLTVNDGRGGVASDTITIQVSAEPINQAPIVSAGTDQTIALPNTVALHGTVTDDGLPQGGTITTTWSQVSGPATATFADANSLITSVTFTQPGTYIFRLTATDSELISHSDTTVAVQAQAVDTISPNVIIGADPSNRINKGNTTIIQVRALDNVGVTSLQVTVNGSPILLQPHPQDPTIQQANFTSATPGIFTVHAVASDAAGNQGQDTMEIRVLDPDDTEAPVVSITAPADGATLSSSTTFTGTATDANLTNYTLDYTPIDQNTYTTFSTGTVSIDNGSLGTLDTTIMENGFYDIRLTATDVNGLQSSVTQRYTVQSDLKIGQFSFSQQDLVIPTAGMPLSVVRTYNSLNQSANDFGYSWTYAIHDMDVHFNEFRREEIDFITEEPFSKRLGGNRDVTLTLPDGRRTTFAFSFTPGAPNSLSQFATWTPPAGVYATLVPTVSNRLYTMVGAQGETAIFWEADPQPGNMEIYDFPGFILSTEDGTQYLLSRDDLGYHELGNGMSVNAYGAAHLTKITDRNSNRIEITPQRIDHFNSQNIKTQSVIFQRDSLNRIIAIYDPNNLDANDNPIGPAAVTYEYDSAGNLIKVNHLTGNGPVYETTAYLYQNSKYPHYITDIQDPRGITPLKTVYDNEGRLIATIDADGNETKLVHDIVGRTEMIYDRLGNPTVHTYDERGNVILTVDPLGHITQRTYDANNNLLSEVDVLGSTTTYTYDDQGNILSRTDPLGNTSSYTYDNFGNVLTQTDPLVQTSTNTYDTRGNLLTASDVLGHTTTNTYDTNGNLLTTIDALNNTTTYGYDASGRMTQKTDALGHIVTYAYDENGNKISETTTRAIGSETETITTQYVFDANNRLTKTISNDGSTIQTSYNKIGKQASTIDQLGHATTFDYESRGNLIATHYADGSSELYSYDANGQRITSTDKAGQVTSYQYDSAGRQTQTTYPDMSISNTAYDTASRAIATTDALGHITTYEYDAAGRRTAVVDALGHRAAFAYDANGNQTSMTDANNHTWIYEYDLANRRTKVIYPDNTIDTTTYDATGRMIAKTDQVGKTTRFTYDAVGRLVQVTDALNQVTSYTYDELGQQLTQTDANNHTTSFEYDNLGHRTKRTLPLGMFETYSYGINGAVGSETDFNGHTTTYSYDNMNRLTQKNPDPSLVGQSQIQFTYDIAGRRTSMQDASGTTTYAYDSRGHLISKATPQGTLSYTYNEQGNLLYIQSSHSNGVSVNYEYDILNRLSKVTDNRLVNGVTTYSYDPVGNLYSYFYPNGVATLYAYNTLNRLTAMQLAGPGGVLASYNYTLGATGNRLSVTELNGRKVEYQYDNLYRLTRETIANAPVLANNGAISYNYDPVGNRLNRTSSITAVPTTTSTFDSNDRLLSDTYDNNGNTLASAGKTFTYEFENRLTSMSNGEVTFIYDGDGNRVAKTVGGVTTHYLVDTQNLTGYAQVVEEIIDGQVKKVYTYGSDLISQNQFFDNTWQTSFYGYDGHGNVRLLTDTNGNVTDTYDYDAFGVEITKTGTTPNDYMYCGEQYDPNMGFYYLRARYMNPTTDRFWTMDDFEGIKFEPVTLHKYLYANGNPMNNIDPSGNITIAGTNLPELMITISIISALAYYTVRAIRSIKFEKIEIPIILIHYTDWVGLFLITLTNSIKSPSFPETYYSPDWHISATIAKSKLALPGIRNIAIVLRIFRFKDGMNGPQVVTPKYGELGGGNEYWTYKPIPYHSRVNFWYPMVN